MTLHVFCTIHVIDHVTKIRCTHVYACNCSTQGQNLTTSIFIGENIYTTIVAILGLLNLALLLGNMEVNKYYCTYY